MELCIFTEPQQGASHAELARLAVTAEEAGYTGFFRSDHYLAMGQRDGLPGPTDAWVTLGALAVQTHRIRLGTLVTSATFRLPGPLAITVAQVDQMSGGRIEVGIGAGWFEAEHRAYGIPFPAISERFDRLGEQLELLTSLWGAQVGERVDYAGTHYRVHGSPALPKPVQQPHPPVIIGGTGPVRTPALAARFAAEFNVPFQPAPVAAAQFDRVAQACEEAGRKPETMRRSAALVLCCGRDEAQLRQRAAAIGREVPELRENGLAGTPDEVVEAIGRYSETSGVHRIYLQTLDVTDLDHVELVAERVMPQLAAPAN